MKKIVFLRSNNIFSDSRVQKEAFSLKKKGYIVKIIGWDRLKNHSLEKKVNYFNKLDFEVNLFGIKASFGEGFKNLVPFIKFQMLLFLWLSKNKKKYDIIHACDFDTAFVSYVIKKIFKKKYVFDIFDYKSSMLNGKMGKIIEKLEKKIINNSDATIICTEQRKNQITGSNPNKLVIVHNSPLTEIIETGKEKIKSDKIKLAYFGILQNHRLILEMINVISKNKEVELHIGGFGKHFNKIEKLSKKYKNIYFYGEIPYEKVLQIEDQCDIMTAIYKPSIPNHKYAAPNKFYEALMLGKPLIMSKNIGMCNEILKNNLGELIDFSEEEFKKGLERLIKRKDEWSEISLKMKEIYNEKYSWNIMEKRIIELYKKI